MTGGRGVGRYQILRFWQTWRSSFSAVSTPIFASKYSLESSRRDLHNALLCTIVNSQNFVKFCVYKFQFFFVNFVRNLLNFRQIDDFSPQISRNFAGICSGNPRKLLRFSEICSKILKSCEILRNFEILQKQCTKFCNVQKQCTKFCKNINYLNYLLRCFNYH